MKKVMAGFYTDEFEITFNTIKAVAGATEGKTRTGIAKVSLTKEDEVGLWFWRLEVVSLDGQRLYTEGDPYPFESKKEATAYFNDMKASTATNPFTFSF